MKDTCESKDRQYLTARLVKVGNTGKHTSPLPVASRSKTTARLEPGEVSTGPRFTHGVEVGAVYTPVEGRYQGRCSAHQEPDTITLDAVVVPILASILDQAEPRHRIGETHKPDCSRIGLDAAHCEWNDGFALEKRGDPHSASVPPLRRGWLLSYHGVRSPSRAPWYLEFPLLAGTWYRGGGALIILIFDGGTMFLRGKIRRRRREL